MEQINMLPNVKKILSFGGGVDSSAILLIHLFSKNLGVEMVVFADTGAEHPDTYRNVEYFQKLCTKHNLPFFIVKKEGETITDWCLRLGVLPVMAGGSHICSKKFKGDVIAKWAKSQGIDKPVYLIGIEANEGYRCERFTPPADDKAEYQYPLVEMNLDRAACQKIISDNGIEVRKSSCVFCPFMSPNEIKSAMKDPHSAQVIRMIESNFEQTSARKHAAWLDAGKPVDRAGRALRGMWKKDSWKEGRRLFVKKVNGKQLTVSQWTQQLS
jgi:PP-loop superfamily ATP-utilizing enzyme